MTTELFYGRMESCQKTVLRRVDKVECNMVEEVAWLLVTSKEESGEDSRTMLKNAGPGKQKVCVGL